MEHIEDSRFGATCIKRSQTVLMIDGVFYGRCAFVAKIKIITS